MREFEYFLFENFDADKESQNPYNPRRFLGKETDAVLSMVAGQEAGDCTYSECSDRFGTEIVRKLIDGGAMVSPCSNNDKRYPVSASWAISIASGMVEP